MSARVFAVHAGAEIAIGHYGTATPETAAVVPDEVGAEFEANGRCDLRIERDQQPAAAPPRLSAKEIRASQPSGAAEEK